MNLKLTIHLKTHSEFFDVEDCFQSRTVASKLLNKQSRTVDKKQTVMSLDAGLRIFNILQRFHETNSYLELFQGIWYLVPVTTGDD